MPRTKTAKKLNNLDIDICLDEIEVSQTHLNEKPSNESRKTLEGWIRKQKIVLKALGYKGRMPRQQRRKTS